MTLLVERGIDRDAITMGTGRGAGIVVRLDSEDRNRVTIVPRSAILWRLTLLAPEPSSSKNRVGFPEFEFSDVREVADALIDWKAALDKVPEPVVDA